MFIQHSVPVSISLKGVQLLEGITLMQQSKERVRHSKRACVSCRIDQTMPIYKVVNLDGHIALFHLYLTQKFKHYIVKMRFFVPFFAGAIVIASMASAAPQGANTDHGAGSNLLDPRRVGAAAAGASGASTGVSRLGGMAASSGGMAAGSSRGGGPAAGSGIGQAAAGTGNGLGASKGGAGASQNGIQQSRVADKGTKAKQ